MAEIKIIEEKSLTSVEVKEKLTEIKKRDKELNFRANKTKEYLDKFAKQNLKTITSLRDKIINLNISRLKDRHIVKILDVMPKDLESLRTLFVGETITIKPEDLNRILECLK